MFEMWKNREQRTNHWRSTASVEKGSGQSLKSPSGDQYRPAKRIPLPHFLPSLFPAAALWFQWDFDVTSRLLTTVGLAPLLPLLEILANPQHWKQGNNSQAVSQAISFLPPMSEQDFCEKEEFSFFFILNCSVLRLMVNWIICSVFCDRSHHKPSQNSFLLYPSSCVWINLPFPRKVTGNKIPSSMTTAKLVRDQKCYNVVTSLSAPHLTGQLIMSYSHIM